MEQTDILNSSEKKTVADSFRQEKINWMELRQMQIYKAFEYLVDKTPLVPYKHYNKIMGYTFNRNPDSKRFSRFKNVVLDESTKAIYLCVGVIYLDGSTNSDTARITFNFGATAKNGDWVYWEAETENGIPKPYVPNVPTPAINDGNIPFFCGVSGDYRVDLVKNWMALEPYDINQLFFATDEHGIPRCVIYYTIEGTDLDIFKTFIGQDQTIDEKIILHFGVKFSTFSRNKVSFTPVFEFNPPVSPNGYESATASSQRLSQLAILASTTSMDFVAACPPYPVVAENYI